LSTREAVVLNSPEDREKVVRWARGVSDGTIVEFRKSTRSHEQNAKMHAMLGEVSAQVVWYGQKLKVEDWKNMFTASLRKASVVPGIDPGTVVPLGIHTSTMTIDEVSNMIELIYAFGAENNVTFKEPKPDNTNSDDTPPAPSSDNAGMTPANEAGADGSPASDAPASTDAERDILIRFAAEMLPMAATAPTEAWKEVEKGWSEGEMKKLSAGGLEKAKAISMSLRAIAKGNTSLESAVEYYAEVLGATVKELGGVDG
jgi:NinB protein